MSTVDAFRLVIPGAPVGWARPRFVRRGEHMQSFTDPKARSYAERIGTEWIAAGRPALAAGPFRLVVVAFMTRPKGHWRAGGGLSAAGMRAGWYPTTKPDLDNIAKLVCDALMGVEAIPDDAALVDLRVGKQYLGAVSDGAYVAVLAESLLEGGEDLHAWTVARRPAA